MRDTKHEADRARRPALFCLFEGIRTEPKKYNSEPKTFSVRGLGSWLGVWG